MLDGGKIQRTHCSLHHVGRIYSRTRTPVLPGFRRKRILPRCTSGRTSRDSATPRSPQVHPGQERPPCSPSTPGACASHSILKRKRTPWVEILGLSAHKHGGSIFVCAKMRKFSWNTRTCVNDKQCTQILLSYQKEMKREVTAQSCGETHWPQWIRRKDTFCGSKFLALSDAWRSVLHPTKSTLFSEVNSIN